MEINVDYLGVRVVDLSGDGRRPARRVGRFPRQRPGRGDGPAVPAVLRGHRTARRRAPDGRQLPGGPRAGRPDDRPGAARAQPGLAGRRRRPGVPFPSGDRRRSRSGWTTRPPSAPGPRPMRSARSAGCRSSTCPARSASVAPWWSTARCSADGTAGAGRSATPWSIPPVRAAAAAPLGCLEQYAGKDALMRSAAMDLDLPVESLIDAARGRRRGRAGLAGQRCRARWAPPWPTPSTWSTWRTWCSAASTPRSPPS